MLQIVENELRTPAGNEVRIKVICTGVGFTDVIMRYGNYIFAPKIPFVPGYEIVGIVDALGENVKGVLIGQRVAALTVHGGYSEYIYLPPEELVTVPDGLDAVDALSLILNYVTAYQMLHREAQVQSGQKVLITGASGGVGNALLQLGQLAGLKMYGTTSKKKQDLVRQLGGIPIDYRGEDFVAVLREQEPEGIDAVFDAVGWRFGWRAYKTLRRGGKLVSFGQTASVKNGKVNVMMGYMDFLLPFVLNVMPDGKSGTFYGITGLYRKDPLPFREDLPKLFELLVMKKVKPIIDSVLPLTEAVHANEMIENGDVKGKLVLMCTDQ